MKDVPDSSEGQGLLNDTRDLVPNVRIMRAGLHLFLSNT